MDARVKNGPALAGHGAEAVRDSITSTITRLPEQLRRSLTWDQGAEMSQHARLKIETGLDVYFCDPHSPWQRGTNENTNGLLRRISRKAPTLERFPLGLNRDSQCAGKGGVLADDSVSGMRHDQALFGGFAGACG